MDLHLCKRRKLLKQYPKNNQQHYVWDDRHEGQAEPKHRSLLLLHRGVDAIKAAGGAKMPASYGGGNDSIWLWTEANAPAWAYPGPVHDGHDIAAEKLEAVGVVAHAIRDAEQRAQHHLADFRPQRPRLNAHPAQRAPQQVFWVRAVRLWRGLQPGSAGKREHG